MTIVRMMGYICTEGLQAREPAATKENEYEVLKVTSGLPWKISKAEH